MTKTTKESYEQNAAVVAKALLGRYVVYRKPNGKQIRIQLTEIAAYEGEEKTTSEGALYAPGTVSVSTKFGRQLIDIATGRKGQPSCITLRRGNLLLENKVRELEGPGAVAKSLGVTADNKNILLGEQAYGDIFWIEGNSANNSHIKKLKGNAPNCKGIYKLNIDDQTSREQLEGLLDGYLQGESNGR